MSGEVFFLRKFGHNIAAAYKNIDPCIKYG